MMSYTTLRMDTYFFKNWEKKNPDTCGQGLNMKIFKTEK